MSKLNWKKVIGWAVAALVVIGVVGTNMYNQQQNSDNSKRIVYAVLPLSGQFASYGKDVQKTMDVYMAQKDFAFQIKYIDSEGNPSKAITALQQATLNDNNPLVISAFSYISTPLAPVVHNKNGFLFGVITASISSDTNSYQRISGNAADVVKPISDYIAKHPKKTNLIYIQDELSIKELNAIKESIKNSEQTINREMVLDMNTLDVRNSVVKLLSDKPERIILLGQPTPGYLNILRELKAQAYQGEVFTDSALSNPPTIKALGDNMEDIYSPTMTIEADIPQPEKVEKMRIELAKVDLPVYISVSEAIDTLDLIQYTLENNLPFSQETYTNLKKWNGLSGNIHFPGKGETFVDFYILTQRRNGKFIPVTE
ncbi:MAG: amino acid ABC transporter substrate-binding protein [Alphaproteobacteria bacterium]|nr:amino acid ABC transporter substrate-binding protein [Alphaproteobacteria bacterium]